MKIFALCAASATAFVAKPTDGKFFRLKVLNFSLNDSKVPATVKSKIKETVHVHTTKSPLPPISISVSMAPVRWPSPKTAVTIKSKSVAQSVSSLMIKVHMPLAPTTVTTFIPGVWKTQRAADQPQLAVTLIPIKHHPVILTITARTVRSLKLANFSAILWVSFFTRNFLSIKNIFGPFN